MMKRLLAAITLVALFSISTAAPAYAVEDDSQMMQSGTPTTELRVTEDDGTTMRAQGSDLQPAGTGTDAVVDNTAAPDAATQAYMAGETDRSSRVADNEPAENDSKMLYYIGAGIAVAAGVAGALYAIRREAK